MLTDYIPPEINMVCNFRLRENRRFEAKRDYFSSYGPVRSVGILLIGRDICGAHFY